MARSFPCQWSWSDVVDAKTIAGHTLLPAKAGHVYFPIMAAVIFVSRTGEGYGPSVKFGLGTGGAADWFLAASGTLDGAPGSAHYFQLVDSSVSPGFPQNPANMESFPITGSIAAASTYTTFTIRLGILGTALPFTF